jgi:hypothetical protein
MKRQVKLLLRVTQLISMLTEEEMTPPNWRYRNFTANKIQVRWMKKSLKTLTANLLFNRLHRVKPFKLLI